MTAHPRILPIALALLLSPAAAWAQAPAPVSEVDRATARELAKDGKAALERKDYAVAADRFTRADSLVHAPTLLVGLARAEAGLGKWVVACELYRRVLREGVAPGAPAAFADALTDAQRELDELEPRVPGVIINVKGAAKSVTLDGVLVPAAALGVRRPVDPGKHAIRAEADGQAPVDATVTVAERKVETVTLELKPGPQVAPPPPVGPPLETPPPPTAPPPAAQPAAGGARAGSMQRTLGFVALGAGGAGLVVGAITGGLALSKHSDLVRACPDPHTCKSSEVGSFEATEWASTVGFIAGGALAVTGVVLLVTAPRAKPATDAAVVPVLGLGWVGAKGSF